MVEETNYLSNFMKRLNVTFYLKNGKRYRYSSKKFITRIIHKIGLKEFQKLYIYVSYGKKPDVRNHIVKFFNDAWTTDKKEAITIVRDFWKEE